MYPCGQDDFVTLIIGPRATSCPRGLGVCSTAWATARRCGMRRSWQRSERAHRLRVQSSSPYHTILASTPKTALRWCCRTAVRRQRACRTARHAPPHAGDSEAEGANWHAHLLITTRRWSHDILVVGDHVINFTPD